MNRRTLLALAAFGLTQVGNRIVAAELPYDDSADAKAAVQRAFDSAAASRHPVLVIFGANWCEDCRVLDQAMKGGRNAALLTQEFEVVKVDVGRFNRNLDIAHAYGDPIGKGIPAALLLSPDQRVLYMTRAGELADARRMSETGIYDFFRHISEAARHPP